MASTYSDLKVELIGTGEQTGTWGTTTNNNLSVALGEAITGSADVSFSSADVTVTLTDTNAAQTARNLRLNLTGTSGGARNLILGSGCQIEKLYLINNGLADAVTVKNTTGTGIAVPAGKTMFVYNNGTNVVEAVNSAVTLETTQVNITGQGDLRLEDSSGGQYVALQAPATVASSYTLTMPVDDGTNGQALITDGNGVLSWSTAASGDVYGPASATDNAIARFDLTTGKLIQNSSALVDDAGNVLAGAGLVGAPAFSTTGDTNTGIYFPAADTIAFTEGGVESMRIDSSGNVGIGNTPTYSRLDIVDVKAGANFSGLTVWNNTTNATGVSSTINLPVFNGSAGGVIQEIGNSVDGYRLNIYQDQGSGVITFGTGGNNERMRITSTGTVGIGTSTITSGAGWTPTLVLNATSAALVVKGVNGQENSFGTSNGLYIDCLGNSTGTNNNIIFRNTSSNSSFSSTERMRIDSSGNVGIGTSSPNAFTKLHVSGALRVADSTNAANYITIASGNEAPAGGNSVLSETSSMVLGTKANNICLLYTNNTERMRIDSSGLVGIGTSSPATTLDVQAASPSFQVSATTGTNRAYLRASNTSGLFYLAIDSSTGSVFGTAYARVLYGDGAYPMNFYTNGTERMRITSGGDVLVGKTAVDFATAGVALQPAGVIGITRSGGAPLIINRLTNDGDLVVFQQDGTPEGSISVSGTTVSYNGGHLSRWSQLPSNQKDDTLLKGTVMSNLDDMCVWVKDGETLPNEQLNKMKVSDVEGDTNVAGVFVNWTRDEDCNSDDMNIAMTGDMIIRIAQGVVVQKGDLLMSAGDGTAKPQGDDIVRSKTIAKVTSNHVTCTYADGSYCVPCVLMAC